MSEEQEGSTSMQDKLLGVYVLVAILTTFTSHGGTSHGWPESILVGIIWPVTLIKMIVT